MESAFEAGWGNFHDDKQYTNLGELAGSISFSPRVEALEVIISQ
jgi:hypothetical protein